MRFFKCSLFFTTVTLAISALSTFGASLIYDLPIGEDNISVFNSWDSLVETNTLSILCVRNLPNTNETHFTKEVVCVEFQNIDKERPTRVVHTLGIHDDTPVGGCWLINKTTGLYSIKVKDGICRTYVVDFAGDSPKTREISSLLGSSNAVYYSGVGFGDEHRMTDSADVVIPYSKGVICFSGNDFLVIPMEEYPYFDFTCLSDSKVLFCEKNLDIPCLVLRDLKCATRNVKQIAGYDARIPLPGKVRKIPRLQDGQLFSMAETSGALLFFDRSKLYMTRDKGETWVTRDIFDEVGEAIPSAKAVLKSRKSGPFVTRRTAEAIYRGLITFAESDKDTTAKDGASESNRVCQRHAYIQEIRTKDEANYFWHFPALEKEKTLGHYSGRHAMYPLPDQSWVFVITGDSDSKTNSNYFHVIRCTGERIAGEK